MLSSAPLGRTAALLAGAASLTAARDAFALNRLLVRIWPATADPAATAAVAVPATRNLRRSTPPVTPARLCAGASSLPPLAGGAAAGPAWVTSHMIAATLRRPPGR